MAARVRYVIRRRHIGSYLLQLSDQGSCQRRCAYSNLGKIILHVASKRVA